MFMAMMSLIIIASAPLLGGRLRMLATIRLRYSWLIILALAVQVLITDYMPNAPRPIDVGLHLASYLAAGVALWANRSLPGFVVIGVGSLLNATVIALNGGTLPASARAMAAAGFPIHTKDFQNSGVLHHPVLAWFGDIVATPSWLPLRNVISIGDILILVGAVVLVHWVSDSRLPRAVTWLVRHVGQRPVASPAARQPVGADGKF
jgi:hypothetical protein